MDPYYHWLGIPKEDQPANHYRLLGLNLWEANRDVIASAADRQMSFVRQHQTAPETAEISQTILNELMAARLCLLNPTKKAEYDQQLRAALAGAVKPPPRRRKGRAPAGPAVPLGLPAAAPLPSAALLPPGQPQLLPAFRNSAASQPPARRLSLGAILLLAAAGVAAAGLLLGVSISLAMRRGHTEPAPTPVADALLASNTAAETQADAATQAARPEPEDISQDDPQTDVQPPAADRVRPGVVENPRLVDSAPADPPKVFGPPPLPYRLPQITRPKKSKPTALALRDAGPSEASAAIVPASATQMVPDQAPQQIVPDEAPQQIVPDEAPHEMVSLIGDAQKFVAQNRFDDARKKLLQVNLVQRDEPQASFYLGLLAGLVDHDAVEARKQFMRARKAAVAEIACLNNLAITEVRTANVTQAIRYWKEAVQLEPAPEVIHNIGLLFSLADRNRLTVPAAMRKDLQQQLDDANLTLPAARGGWRYMDFNGDSPISAAWGWPNLVDRACLQCNALGTANCPVRACSRGRIRVNTVDTIVLPGRQVITKDRLVPVACKTCRGTGRVPCPYCRNGIDRDL